MAFEELREQLTSRFKDLGQQIQESAAFQSLKEKYDDLPSNQQKIVMIGLAAVLGFFIFSFPYDGWNQSEQSLVEFQERRDLIRELLKVTKETQEATSFPTPPSMGQIKTDMEMRLQQFQLIPEQMGGVNVELPNGSLLVASARQEGVIKVLLKKLNLRQVVDVTSALQTLHPTVKLANLNIDSNLADPRYLDASLDFIMIKIPQISVETEDEPAPPPRRRGRK